MHVLPALENYLNLGRLVMRRMKYKEVKEKLVKKLAEQYRNKVPYKVYRAMMEWQIEIKD